ncbi:MAG: hypothetical protein KAX49_14820 [Halanaerobiales bacterium]|nr:hypothetical protein [Halanaerobiales bacterium]
MEKYISQEAESFLNYKLKHDLSFLPEELFKIRFPHEKIFFISRAYTICKYSLDKINSNIVEVMTHKP